MKKILIAVALLGLSSTSFGATNQNDYDVSCQSVNSHASNKNWSQVASEIPRLSNALGRTPTESEMKTCVGSSKWQAWQDSSNYVPATPTPGGSVVTNDELNASQHEQDQKQASVDQTQNERLYNAEVNIDDAKSIGQNANNNAINAQNTADVAVGIGQNANNNAINAQNTANTAIGIGQDAKNTAINAQNTADYAVGLGQDNSNRIINETNERIASDEKIVKEQKVVDDNQNIEIAKKVDTTTFNDDQERQDAVIATKASKEELANETTSRKSADAQLSSRIDSNDATLVQHDERITSNTNRIGSVEKRVSNFENQTNRRFSDIDKRIGDNRKVASAGIAGAGAMANIPQVTQNGNVSVGAGIGGYDGEQAVAVGFSARVSESVTTKVSVSTNTQSEVLWGAGVGVEW